MSIVLLGYCIVAYAQKVLNRAACFTVAKSVRCSNAQKHKAYLAKWHKDVGVVSFPSLAGF